MEQTMAKPRLCMTGCEQTDMEPVSTTPTRPIVCEGIGLECYGCWTAAGIYGHTANVVKVNGIWFVLDTQAGGFLDYNYGFTEVIDKYENHVADGSMISDYSYEELYG